LFLLANTALAKDLSPRLAQRLKIGLVSDVTQIDPIEDGSLEYVRPVFGGKAFERVRVRTPSAIATLRGNAFAPFGPDEDRIAEIIAAPFQDVEAPKAKLLETIAKGDDTVDLVEADVVVSGGYGLGGPEGFEFLKPLAKALNAAHGASRATVNAGWIDASQQVGQTGKTVCPGLYVACGISGQIQHLAGMSSSKCIVAINKDPQAPIFKVAHYGIVGDLFQIVPALTEEIRSLKAQV
jgi:electron transfer flavoprotein alpha subunit